MTSKNRWFQIWKRTLQEISPGKLLTNWCAFDTGRRPEAILCWGKAASAYWEAISQSEKKHGPALVICPIEHQRSSTTSPVRSLEFRQGAMWVYGEHPLPGEGSFRAGSALLEFLALLDPTEVSGLRVFLSGGASSLAWVLPTGVNASELQRRLQSLYCKPISIEELNQERSRLCLLKGGGVAHWLRRFHPNLPVRVELLSDVWPFSPEQVVGSGPFHDGKIPHHVSADNRRLVELLAQAFRKEGLTVVHQEFMAPSSWKEWFTRITFLIRAELRKSAKKERVLIFGGEPWVGIRSISSCVNPGEFSGGRQTHLAAALLLELQNEIFQRKCEIFCLSTDGVDGNSGAAGAQLSYAAARALLRKKERSAFVVNLKQFRSAVALKRVDALVCEERTDTNVQDIVFVVLSRAP